ncbi:hypothetical protein, conserved [Trypanosoma brucei gambiense DAL972]|uniref:SAM-dependent MTase RsmB/NOP-type domain-containing protein n=2 Tax=Trypanosoma brucei TaxID=5691 RepID=C9ZLE8_TRYB9|nr:hypothetical protein, conserved [Trypanosoma brucei gambiense DAL972]RHW73508.1 NOL1/NOP2/sun family [Trypanosoma brucei equiperdum]CBH10157.1 hypothetical protein, conserved [Trypanosoma brucei gambiense DAL972]|eukprot:XP_011772447.1 hypothetical protein, conserved [Trypanosoma brucei gambiense DAL972]
MSDDASQNYPSSFTEEFINYCRAHRLPPQLFHDLRELLPRMPRYVRIRPSDAQQIILPCSCDQGSRVPSDVIHELSTAVGGPTGCVYEVEWLPRPYCLALPRDTAVSQLELYRSGVVSAMDAASIAAVVALRPRRGETVWDVCCSPGMKLSFIADAIGEEGSAVGTDINLDRLFAARSVMKKHRANNVCLFVADGTSFALRTAVAVAQAARLYRGKSNTDGLTALEERRLRYMKKRRAGGAADSSDGTVTRDEDDQVALVFTCDEARKRLVQSGESANQKHYGFDRVLVDAECSHDGSLAHMFLGGGTKRPFAGHDGDADVASQAINNEQRMQRLNLSLPDGNEFTNAEVRKMSPLQQLQLQLLTNGYAQLNPGGTLVYCTCSFTYQQNEGIVQEMMHSVNADAETMERYGGEAVLCSPFCYEHEVGLEAQVSPIVILSGTQVGLLKQRLAAAGDPYGVTTGLAREGAEEVGVRFWPHIFSTSFQFISKVWKKPLI